MRKIPRSIYVYGKVYRKSNGKLYRCGERGNLIKLTPEETAIHEGRKKAAAKNEQK